jgi:hypothetical protein
MGIMNQLAIIAAAAQSYGIPFLLGGGHAVIAHGFAQSTFDVDLIARQTDRDKWLQLARSAGYELYQENPNFLQFNAAAEGTFPLDLMFINDATFAKMQAAAVASPSGLEGLRVVSQMHLLALKCHAVKFGHPGRIVKDGSGGTDLIRTPRTFAKSSEDMALMNFMRELEGLARSAESMDLIFLIGAEWTTLPPGLPPKPRSDYVCCIPNCSRMPARATPSQESGSPFPNSCFETPRSWYPNPELNRDRRYWKPLTQ